MLYVILGAAMVAVGAELIERADPAWIGVVGVLVGTVAGIPAQRYLAELQHRHQLDAALLDHRIRACVDFVSAVDHLREVRHGYMTALRRRRDGQPFDRAKEDSAVDGYIEAQSEVVKALWEVNLLLPKPVGEAADVLWGHIQSVTDRAAEGDVDLEPFLANHLIENDSLRSFRDVAADHLQRRT